MGSLLFIFYFYVESVNAYTVMNAVLFNVDPGYLDNIWLYKIYLQRRQPVLSSTSRLQRAQ